MSDVFTGKCERCGQVRGICYVELAMAFLCSLCEAQIMREEVDGV